MSDRKLAVLGILAVLAVCWAVLQNRMSQTVKTPDFGSAPLIAGLDLKVVDGLQITSEGGSQTTTLKRSDQGFTVVDKDNYPADISKINTMINHCLDIRTNEKITDDPQNHADLKVTPETGQYVIRFLDREGQEIVGIAISPTDEKSTAFARLLSADDVYSVQSPPWLNTRPLDYIDTELFQIQQDQIQRIAVNLAGEDAYVLSSPSESDQVILENMPVGKQYKSTLYKTVFGALSSVRFEDVMEAGKAAEDVSFEDTYNCRLYDKTVYKLQLAKKDEKTYVKVSADYLDKSPVEKTVGQVETEEELKAKEAKLLAIDAVKAFNQKHEGWIYQIPSYKAGDLTKPLSELLEDIPAEEKISADPSAVD
jgi:hypothetical protein